MAHSERPAIMVDLLEDHFDELDFLWEQRERIVFDIDYDLNDFTAHEERAWAHLDGLKLGREHSLDLARPHLDGDAVGAATAAAFIFLAMERSELVAELMERFTAGGPEVREGIRIALRHREIGAVLAQLREATESGDPDLRSAAIDILAFHRLPCPAIHPEWLTDGDPLVRARLTAALGRGAPGTWSPTQLGVMLDMADPVPRMAALAASARLGMAGLAGLCRQVAMQTENLAPEALAFLGVVGGPEELEFLQEMIKKPGLGTAALEGLGALGDVAAIPSLVSAMPDPVLAHAAGAAFRRITGADDIDADGPLPVPEGMSEEEADFLDSSLPPDPNRAEEWWARENGRFEKEGRWQAGSEVSEDPLGNRFNDLPLPCRRDLYLRECVLHRSETPDLELEATAELQVQKFLALTGN